jgi:hypothetical protein
MAGSLFCGVTITTRCDNTVKLHAKGVVVASGNRLL